MSSWRVLVALSAVIIIAESVDASQAVAESTVQAPAATDWSSSDPAWQAEIQFREAMGLSTDPVLIANTMVDPSADRLYGVALTLEERAEIDRRVKIQASLDPLTKRATELDGFGGLWIDQRAGGVINVGVTVSAKEAAAALEPLLPPGAELRVTTVLRTLAALEDVANRIGDDLVTLSAQGIAVGHLYVDVPGNGVVVGLLETSADALQALKVRYGDFVATEASAPEATSCTGRETCPGPPRRAGISGGPAGTSLHGRCTIAFLVHYGQYIQWLTAGHCAKTVGVAWYHAGNTSWPMGTIKATCWPQCQSAEAARGGNLSVENGEWQLVYGDGGTGGLVTVIDEIGLNSDHIGDFVCLNARMAEAWRCGTLHSIGTFNYGGGVYHTNMRFATYADRFGDSGGPVHSAVHTTNDRTGVTALGIQSGCTYLVNEICRIDLGGYSVYSHLGWIRAELGVTTCTELSPCPYP